MAANKYSHKTIHSTTLLSFLVFILAFFVELSIIIIITTKHILPFLIFRRLAVPQSHIVQLPTELV